MVLISAGRYQAERKVGGNTAFDQTGLQKKVEFIQPGNVSLWPYGFDNRSWSCQGLELRRVERFKQAEAEHLGHLLEGVVLFDDSFQARE